MKTWKKLCVLGLMLVISPFSALANKVGGDAYPFLRIGVGARAVGLGGAFVSLAEDGTALYWNPAGIGASKKKNLDIAYTLFSAANGAQSGIGTKHYYLGYIHPNLLFDGGVGIGVIGFGLDGGAESTGIDEYKEIDRKNSVPLEDSTNTFILGFGRYIIRDMFYGGLNFKFITHSLAGHSGHGLGVDLGLLSDISSVLKDKDGSILWIIHHLRMGMRTSVNSDKSWDSGHSDPGFMEMKVGASFEPVLFYGGYKWIVALSLDNVRGRPLTLSAGTEFQILNLGIDSIAVRAGMNNYYLEQRDTLIPKEDLNKGASYYSLGFGGRRGFLGFDLSTSFERLGTKHRLSFNVRF